MEPEKQRKFSFNNKVLSYDDLPSQHHNHHNDLNYDKDNIEQQQNTTYYYSNFDLFRDANKFTYIKYQKFIKNMRQFLGTDWHIYARQVAYMDLGSGKKGYMNEIQLFDLFLENWLQLRSEYHSKRKKSIDEGSSEEDIKFYEENGMLVAFTELIRSKLEGYQIEQWAFNPVANGFFMASVTIWNQTLEELKQMDSKNIINLQEQENIDQLSRVQLEEEDLGQRILNTVQSTVQSTIAYTQKYKIIKPLMVVSEKILNYLNKSVKTENNSNQREQKNMEDTSESDLKNFSNFKSNLFTEEEIVLDKLRNIKIEDEPINRKRRNSEFNSEKQNVELKKFSQKEEKTLQNFVINAAEEYLKTFKQTTQDKWQVARGFVTNIIELNNSMIQKTLDLPSQVKQNINIRFLQPANDFYNHLLEIWILFKNKQNGDKNFQEFLEKVKQSFGENWNEKLIIPTKFFFKTLVSTWEKLVTNKDMLDKEDQEISKQFIDNLRDNMHQYWEQYVISSFKNIEKKQPNQSNPKQTPLEQ